jgi:formate-dependent nitrite reductase cytochrome c552 subunit
MPESMLYYNCKRKGKEVLKMTVEEIKKRIEQLKNRLFMMNMIDRWTVEDEQRVEQLTNEMHELEMQIA